jgi:hypothetical protein
MIFRIGGLVVKLAVAIASYENYFRDQCRLAPGSIPGRCNQYYLVSFCRVFCGGWTERELRAFGAVKARTTRHAKVQPRAPPHLPRDFRVPPFLFETYAPTARRCLPVIISSQSLFEPVDLNLSALSDLRRAVNRCS